MPSGLGPLPGACPGPDDGDPAAPVEDELDAPGQPGHAVAVAPVAGFVPRLVGPVQVVAKAHHWHRVRVTKRCEAPVGVDMRAIG